jgi:hypothetical protein
MILAAVIAAPILMTLSSLTQAAAPVGIRAVDFRNFTYTPSCAGEGNQSEKITVKKGAFSREKEVDGYTDRFYFSVLSVEYGDLTGNGQEEAAINTVCNTGGTGQFTEGLIYTMKAGKPALAVRLLGGDRADGGIRELTISSGLLVAEINDSERNSGACCPEGIITSRFRLTGGKLSEVGTGVKRELYPKQRLAFDKGTSGTSFTVTIAAGDRKRYTVGARAGQTLEVVIDTGDASVSTLGDLESTSGTNRFTAKLPRGGDHSFEVTNDGEKAIQVKVRVTIR